MAIPVMGLGPFKKNKTFSNNKKKSLLGHVSDRNILKSDIKDQIFPIFEEVAIIPLDKSFDPRNTFIVW
jgi:hypothetical protein